MDDEQSSLRKRLAGLGEAADAFFNAADDAIARSAEEVRTSERGFVNLGRAAWEIVPEEIRQMGESLREQVVRIGIELLDAAKSSPLLGRSDANEIRLGLRSMTASLRLRSFQHHDSYAITEEDRVFGIMPEEESENPTTVAAATMQFHRSLGTLADRVDFIQPSADKLATAIVASEVGTVRKYRPNTAFIMMQIDDKIPRLEDIKCSIKEVFKSFGISAMRSDEIEHQDVLTQRILDEIATSEFLIADLTGERPSVYYEVGYAHACGKRPILYRERGTRLHFDLSVHNVPEYENITDLKNKLTKRLEAITNRLVPKPMS